MLSVKEYMAHALKAEELAAKTSQSEHKERLATIAQMWRDLAKHREHIAEIDKART